MVAILLAGMVAYRFLPLSALPQVDYPTIQVQTFYPGASPEVMTSSVTAPLERQFGQMPGLNQMTSTSSAGASVITLQFNLELDARRRRAGGAGRDQRRRQPAAGRPAGAADLHQGQPGRRAGPDARRSPPTTLPLTEVQDLADTRLAQKISQLPGVGLVSISGGQRPGGAHPGQSAARSPPTASTSTTCAPRSRNANVNHAKGNFDGPAQRLHDQRQRPARRRRATTRTLIVAYRNGAPVRLSDVADVVDGAENVKLGRLGERRRRRSSSTSSASRAPTSSRWSTASRRCCRSCRPRCRPSVDVTVLTDRTTTIRASVARRAVRADARRRAGGAGDLPVPAQPARRPSSRACRCRSRWSAPSA